VPGAVRVAAHRSAARLEQTRVQREADQLGAMVQ
jgi:hypothetical protein